jgi:hypothetical protein
MIGALVLSVGALPFSVEICHAGLIFLLAGWALEGQWGLKIAIIRHSFLLQLVMAIFLIQLFGLAFSESIRDGWFSLEKKIFFVLVPVCLATTSIKLSAKEIRWVANVFVSACFIGTLFCLGNAWREADLFLAGSGQVNPYLDGSSYAELNPLQSQTWLFFSYVGLSSGIGIHPTYLSLYLAFCILYLLYNLSSANAPSAQAGSYFLIVYFSLFIVFLSSRIIILGLSFTYLAVLISSIATKRRSVTLAVVLVSLGFSLLIFFNPVSHYRNLQEIDRSTFRIEPDHEYTNAAQIRVSLWWLAVKSLDRWNPFVGSGTGDVKEAMRKTSEHYHITNIIKSLDPHNQYLTTLLGNGAPAAIVLILYLALPLYLSWLHKHYLLLGFSFFFCLLCFTESALELQKGIVFYSLFFPLLGFQLHGYQTTTVNIKAVLSGTN